MINKFAVKTALYEITFMIFRELERVGFEL